MKRMMSEVYEQSKLIKLPIRKYEKTDQNELRIRYKTLWVNKTQHLKRGNEKVMISDRS